MKAMKPSRIIAIIAFALLLADCSDRPEDLLFTDYFVSIQDENGSESSRVLATSNNLVKTYYLKLVSVARTEPLTVYFDIEIGDGLTKGVDFTLQRDVTSIDFEPGVYQKPEKVMAAIFGFPQFRTEKPCQQLEGTFGYWYRRMDE